MISSSQLYGTKIRGRTKIRNSPQNENNDNRLITLFAIGIILYLLYRYQQSIWNDGVIQFVAIADNISKLLFSGKNDTNMTIKEDNKVEEKENNNTNKEEKESLKETTPALKHDSIAKPETKPTAEIDSMPPLEPVSGPMPLPLDEERADLITLSDLSTHDGSYSQDSLVESLHEDTISFGSIMRSEEMARDEDISFGKNDWESFGI